MKVIHKTLLALLSGILLSLSWPLDGFPGILFVAFIPLLIVENDRWKNREKNRADGILYYSALTFLLFNSLTTYWIYNATWVGVVAAVFLNTFLMSMAFLLFHVTHRKMRQPGISYLALIGYWLSYEFLHLRWDLNWPWLNLGNGFAAYPQWIQWYEYTGIFGGSLWVLAVNIMLFRFVDMRFIQKICSRRVAIMLITGVLLFSAPLAFSFFIYKSYKEAKSPVEVVVVQPNLDPYSEQYDLEPMEVTARMLNLAKQKTDSLTQFIVFPESALQEYAMEDQLAQVGSIVAMKSFMAEYPRMAAVVGMSTRREFKDGEPLSITARKYSDANRYYDAYNTALYIAHDGNTQTHHKSRLTPGVEKMPYPKTFHFLERYALDLGGTVGSLATDPEQIPFKINDSLLIAPVICYESVYGEFVNQFVRNGANVIFVITNDGWWGDTPGHRQHLLFSALRAIETRRSIARSANTGISCFINQRGDISEKTTYWKPEVIKGTINANQAITFYVTYGDVIARVSLLLAALMLLLTISVSFTGTRKPLKKT